MPDPQRFVLLRGAVKRPTVSVAVLLSVSLTTVLLQFRNNAIDPLAKIV
jgi:hypothetical protein